MGVLAELATAWVALRVSTQGMQGDVRKALTGIEPEAEKTGKSMGSKLSSGIGSALKKTAIGVGVAGGAALAAGLTKGVGRLNSIEQAQAKLTGLGNSAADVGGIMENALAAVKGTSYGLEEAATVAASVVAAGIKPGKELEGVLKTVGDTAAIAGISMADMGSVFGKVAATGKLQGDTLMQLSDRGIPALQMLSDHLGETTDDVRKMVSDGKIDFKTFADAMEKGVGGAALEMGNTTSGAFKNMWAAAGRLGATLAGPFFTQAGGAFRGITDLLDEMNDRAKPAMEQFASFLTGSAVPALLEFGSSALSAFQRLQGSRFAATAMADLRNIFVSVSSSAAEVWPSLVKIGGALGEASQALGVSAWQVFVAGLQVASGVLQALVGPLETVADVMQSQPSLVTAAVAAWLAFKTVPMLVGGVGNAVDNLTARTRPLRDAFSGFGDEMRLQQVLYSRSTEQINMFGDRVAGSGEQLSRMDARMAVVQTRVGGFGGVVSKLTDALGGPLNIGLMMAGAGLAALAAHSQKAQQQQDALRDSSERLAESQHDVAEALRVSGGELSTEVWKELEAQVRSTRSSIESVAQSGPGLMGALGGASRAAAGLYGALILNNSALAGNAAATIESTFEQARLASESEKAAAAIDGLGLTNEQIASRVYGSAAAWSHLRGQIDTTTEGGAQAQAILGGLRSEFERQQESIAAIGPEFFTLRDALDTLADSASTADQKLNSMRAALEQMGLIQTTAEQQVANVAAAVEKLGDSFTDTSFAADEFGRVFQNADGTLNLLNTNTQGLNDSLTSMQSELMGVASSGGDALGLFQSLQPELDGMRAKAEAAGIDFDGLLATYGMTPETISTMISLAGVDESQTDLLAIADKLRAVGVGVDVPVEIRGGEAGRLELEKLGIRVREFDAESGEATVYVDNQIALSRILDTQGLLGRLDNTSSISDILAVNGDAEGKIWQTQGGLNALDATNPLSSIMAENGQAQGAIGATQGGLDRLGNTNPQSAIRADNSQANSAISQAMGWLNNIPQVKTTQVIFNAVYRGFRNLMGGDGEQHGGAWDGSRSLPRFAGGGHSGYRLPTSGPGTEVTDGFLAFNSRGIPAAHLDAGEWIINGRSSEKYNRELAAINAGTFPKLPGYAAGGRADAGELLDFVHGRGGHGQSRSLEGAPYVFGGINWGDCSGAMSAIARFAVGLAPFASRFTTMTQREGLLGLGFKLGRGGSGDLRMGWLNGGPGGGHTSGTLPDGTNVEMGGSRGNGQIGGGAAPASHSQYTDHAYLPIHTWNFGGIKGLDGLMPPGDTNFGPLGLEPASNPGLYSSPGNSSKSGASKDQPRTWSDLAAGAAAKLVGGQVSDALGVFGIPDQLPPIMQAWQMLNERPGDGPSDWELSTAAAEVKGFDASIELQERAIAEIARALDGMKSSPLGDPLASQMAAAEADLATAIRKLDGDREARSAAQDRLDQLLDERTAALSETDNTSGLAVEKLRNSVLDKEESLRKAKTSLSDAESKTGKDRDEGKIVDAKGRVAKAERDLDMAQKRLAEAEAKATSGLAGALEQPPGLGLADEIRRNLEFSYDPAKGAEQWRPMVEAALRNQGKPVDKATVDKFIRQIDTESKGDPNIAQQIVDVNGTGEAAGVGLGQIIPSTWAAWRDPKLPDDRRDPWAHLNAMVRYVYGVPGKLDQIGRGHGYNLGGFIQGLGTKDSVPLVGAPGEFIVNRRAAAQNRDLLEQINAGRPVPQSSGGGVTYNIYAFDLNEAMATTARREAQHAQTFMGAR